MLKVKYKLKQYFYTSWWVYLLVVICFLFGLFFGFRGMASLAENQTATLGILFTEEIADLEKNFSFTKVTRQALLHNTVDLGKIFLLGLTIIGLPFVLIIIFTRGFVLGFVLEFLLREKAWRGGVLALLAVVPPNLLSLPTYFLGAVTAINFSFYLMKGSSLRKGQITQYLLEYLLLMFILLVIMFGAALLEGYLTPLFFRMFC